LETVQEKGYCVIDTRSIRVISDEIQWPQKVGMRSPNPVFFPAESPYLRYYGLTNS